VSTTMRTVEKMFNVPINYYAMVNMSGLGQIVDYFGGIRVCSPLTFNFSQDTAKASGKNLYHFDKGETSFKYAVDGVNFKKYNTMNGNATLAFARMRYEDENGDYGRTKRQRLILQAIINKVEQNPLHAVNRQLLNIVSKNLATDITWNNAVTMISKYRNASKYVHMTSVNGVQQIYQGISYQRITSEERQKITNLIRISLDLNVQKTGSEFSGNVSNYQTSSVGEVDNWP
jgi:polyisoprenyl-teichoic acid--peptidoglycan teichoic acid transferase